MAASRPSEEDHRRFLQSYIGYITAVLSRSRPTTDKYYDKEKYRNAAGIWHSISLLLNVGSKNDPYGAKVVAVTGCRTPQGISALLLSRNVSPDEDGSHPGSYSRVLEVSDIGGKDLATKVALGYQRAVEVPFQQHVRDTVNVIQAFVKRPTTTLEGSTPLFAFIALRCCIKLAYRVQNGKNIWSLKDRQLPTDFIYNKLTESRTTSSSPDTLPRIPDDTFISLPQIFRAHCARLELSEDTSRPSVRADHDSYPVTNENLAKWAGLLRDCVNAIVAHLAKVEEGQTTSGMPTLQLYADLEEQMMLLRRLISGGVLKHVITDSIRKDLDNARKARSSRLENTVLREMEKQAPNRDHASTIQSEGGADDSVEDDDDEALVDEEVEDHLTRHLKTLHIPVDIVESIVRLSSQDAPTIRAVLVNDGPLDKLDGSPFVSSVEAAIQATLQSQNVTISRDKIMNVLKGAESMTTRASVHAEASLMAHALSVHAKGSVTSVAQQSTEASELVAEVLQGHEIAIGVSKKSCFCCDLLARLITAQNGSDNLHFILPGTHSTVFPWYPPPGLPINILETMKGRLTESLTQVLKATVGAGSTQTTPLHSDVELPVGSRDIAQMYSDLERSIAESGVHV